jgi:two-component system, cell cycle response regulator
VGALILLVEDTPHNLELMRYLLEAHGHRTLAADTGEQALALASRHCPDLVVMDLQLAGDLDGYQTLDRMRAAATRPGSAAVPVVAVTALAMVGDRAQALAAGFDGYLTKPLDPQTFVRDIDGYLPDGRRGRSPVEPRGTGVNDLGAPTGPARARSAARVRGTGANVLVVDDSPMNLLLFRSALEGYGYRVTTASDVEEAVRVVRQQAPDLVLCDVHIRGHRGPELLGRLRSVPEGAGVPFAFVTLPAEPLDPGPFGQRVEIIQRPIEPARLVERVEALLVGVGG